MSTKKKIVFGVVFFIVMLLLVLVIVVPILINVDRYRPQIVDYIREQTGKPADIRRLALSVFPVLSIRVDDFTLGNPPNFPRGTFLDVRRIYAELDARALWNRQVLIKSLELDAPAIVLLSDVRGRWNFENPPTRGAVKKASSKPTQTFSLGVVSKIKIAGGQLTVANLLSSGRAGPTYFDARGVSTELDQVDLNAFLEPASVFSAPRPAPFQTAHLAVWEDSVAFALPTASQPAAVGILKSDSLGFGTLRVTAVKSKLRLFTKQVYFDDLNLDLYGGRAIGDLSFDFSGQSPRYNTHARMKGVDVARLLAAFPDARGKMTGKMEGNLTLAGEATHSPDPLAGMRGKGQLIVRNGNLPSLQLNKNLMKLARLSDLGATSGDPSSFSSVSTDLNVTNQRISSNKIVIVGNGIDVDGSGSLSLAGEGSLDYDGVARITAGQNPLTNVLGGLLGATYANGKLTFPFKLEGTLQNPRFRVKSAAGLGPPGLLSTRPGVSPEQTSSTPQQPADLVRGIGELLKKKSQPR